MVVTSGGNIGWSGSTTANTLSYSKDNGDNWTTANSSTTISVSEGDKVLWKGQETFIFGRRSTGRMDLRLLDGTKVNASVGYKNLKLLEMRKNNLVEFRKVV
jgi:hypothetical protein